MQDSLCVERLSQFFGTPPENRSHNLDEDTGVMYFEQSHTSYYWASKDDHQGGWSFARCS